MATLVSKDTSGVFTSMVPPEAGPEIVERRSRYYRVFPRPDAPDGRKRFHLAHFGGPCHYRSDPFSKAEQFKEINLDVVLTPGKDWDAACETNGYQVQFWQAREIGGKTVRMIARFRRAGKWLAMAPLALIYTNTAGQKQVISRPVGGITPIIDNEANTVTWPNAFGPNIDFRYNLNPDRFFKTVIFRKNPRILVPPTIGMTGLRVAVVMSMAWDGSVRTSNGFATSVPPTELSGDDLLADEPDETVVLSDKFSMKDDLHDYCWLQKPRAWDSSDPEKDIALTWRMVRRGAAAFMVLSAPGNAFNLAGTKYPVYMDSTPISEHQTAASTDDAQSYKTTWPGDSTDYTATGTTLTLGADATYFRVNGVRFQSIPIPNAATIDSASLSVRMGFPGVSTVLNIDINGHDADDSDAFGSGTGETGRPGQRTRTTATANWNVGTAAWAANTFYASADISAVVMEIASRGGWVSDNDMSFIITNHSQSLPAGNAYRNVGSWDLGTHVYGPKFNCSYTEAAPPSAYNYGLVI